MKEAYGLQIIGGEEGFRLETDAVAKSLKMDSEKGFFADLKDLAGGKGDLGFGVG